LGTLLNERINPYFDIEDEGRVRIVIGLANRACGYVLFNWRSR